MNSDRGGCRHEDCRLPLDRNFSPTPPAEPSVVGSCGSATATTNFSIRNAAASLTPPLLASRWRARLRHALTGNHPLLFRAADAEPWLSDFRPTQQPHKRHAPPTPKWKPPPCICLSTATISSSVCDATPPQMCGQPMHRLHSGPVSTSALAPRFVGRGERHATPIHISPRARCPAPRRKVFSCVGGSAATSTDNAEFTPLL